MTDKEARNTAYRAGLCADCKKVRYSAGRVRCDACHAVHNPPTSSGADPNNYPCRQCRTNATKPGSVLCYGCFTQLKLVKK